MLILGISSYYHDSAAAIICDGKVICGAEEERFSRIKHDNSFPVNAINFCMKQAGISASELNCIAYYEKPLLKFERILETFVATYPFSLFTFVRTMPEWLGEKIKVEQKIRKELKFKGRVLFIPHHLSHASTAFYPSPFQNAAILTADGVGEYQTTALWIGNKKEIKLLREINFPHSLGLLYSTFTAFLGYRVNDDEYKVMGMAAYGKPRFKEKIYELIDVKKDGSFKMDMSYFSYRESFHMWSGKFERMFGPRRKRNEPIRQKHKDLASSIQEVTEEIYFKILNHLYSITGNSNLCIGGGLALNALANGKIHEKTPFKEVFIFGPAGDSGGAIGAASYAYHINTKINKHSQIKSLKLGSEYSDSEIEEVLKKYKLVYSFFKDEQNLVKKSAKFLSQGKILGWFQDRMEFGPRALGARSILAAPFPTQMREKVNIIKRREQFRPFAGSVLEEKAGDYFEIPKTQTNFPFMNFCFKVLNEKRADIPAITHEDGTCRIQTVREEDGLYYALIKEFERLTRIPVILNTSFNIKGEPIVETPQQAAEDFLRTKMDYLAIGNYIVTKR